MNDCLFVSDLHGSTSRYHSLGQAIKSIKPAAVFLGGDLLPHIMDQSWQTSQDDHDFISSFLNPFFTQLKEDLQGNYPQVFLILGNDDPRFLEPLLIDGEAEGLWRYAHGRCLNWQGYQVLGYSCIPPSPFQLKDWERYDVSRFVDPGAIPPDEGRHTTEVDLHQIIHTTIADELNQLATEVSCWEKTIILAHCPPYDCTLDRAALDGKSIDHVPLDVHIGSIAMRRFLEEHQPLLSLHGHVHESRRLTGEWQTRLGRTTCINAANDGPELALVRIQPQNPDQATLELLT